MSNTSPTFLPAPAALELEALEPELPVDVVVLSELQAVTTNAIAAIAAIATRILDRLIAVLRSRFVGPAVARHLSAT
jgi:hypothetical protein